MDIRPPDSAPPGDQNVPPVAPTAPQSPVAVPPQAVGELKARAPVTRGWFGTKLHNAYVWLLGHLNGWLVRHVVTLDMVKDLSRDDIKALPSDWVNKLTDTQFGTLSPDVISELPAQSLTLETVNQNRIRALTPEQIRKITKVQFDAMNVLDVGEIRNRVAWVMTPTVLNAVPEHVSEIVEALIPKVEDILPEVSPIPPAPDESELPRPLALSEWVDLPVEEQPKRIAELSPEDFVAACRLGAHKNMTFGQFRRIPGALIARIPPNDFKRLCQDPRFQIALSDEQLDALTADQIVDTTFFYNYDRQRTQNWLTADKLAAMSPEEIKALSLFQLSQADLWRLEDQSCLQHLTPSQWSVINFRSLSEEVIINLPPESLARVRGVLQPEIINRLQPAQLAAIGPRQLPGAALFLVTPQALSRLSRETVEAIPISVLMGCRQEHFEALGNRWGRPGNPVTRPLVAWQIPLLTPEQINSFDIMSYSSDEICMLTAHQVQSVPPSQIARFITPEGYANFERHPQLVRQIQFLNEAQLTAISAPAIANLVQARALTDRQYTYLTEEQVQASFTHQSIGFCPMNILQIFSNKFGGAPPPDVLRNMSTEALLAIPAWKMLTLTPEQMLALSDAHLQALFNAGLAGYCIVPRMPPERLRTLSTAMLEQLLPNIRTHGREVELTDAQASTGLYSVGSLPWFPAEAMPDVDQELITNGARSLRTDQIKALSADQIRSLIPEIHMLSVQQIKAMHPWQLELLPLDAFADRIDYRDIVRPLLNQIDALLEPGRIEALPRYQLFLMAIHSEFWPLWTKIPQARLAAIAHRILGENPEVEWFDMLPANMLRAFILEMPAELFDEITSDLHQLNANSVDELTRFQIMCLMATDSRNVLIDQLRDARHSESFLGVLVMLTPEELYHTISTLPSGVQERIPQHAAKEHLDYLREQLAGQAVTAEELASTNADYTKLSEAIRTLDPNTSDLAALELLDKEQKRLDAQLVAWRNRLQATFILAPTLHLEVANNDAIIEQLQKIHSDLKLDLQQALTDYRSKITSRLAASGQLSKPSAEEAEATADYAISILAGWGVLPTDLAPMIGVQANWPAIQEWLTSKGLATDLDLERYQITDQEKLIQWIEQVKQGDKPKA